MTILSRAKDGALVIDVDALADRLGLTTRELKDRCVSYAMRAAVNEGARLAHGEAFEKGLFPIPPQRDSHLVAAFRSFITHPPE